ncbi:MAG: transglycosylase domain-containing protein [Treponema sp.]|nr:transglycosylase domain-containing protein [Treponema sp.]
MKNSSGILKTTTLCAFILSLFYAILRFSPYTDLEAFQQNRSYGMVLLDVKERVIRVFPSRDGVKREWVDLKDIPKPVTDVFIKAEDRRFYIHPGVDPLAIIAGVFRNARAGRNVSGASTISMQLVRMISPHERTFRGKIGEAFNALRLEMRLSKREILELWLNNIPFGSNVEGIQAFTRARFGINVSVLDAERAVILAVVPRRPGLFDPASNKDANLSAALALAEKCKITDKSAIAEYAARAGISGENPFLAPHFSERVKALLNAEDEAKIVRTTLDIDVQNYAEQRLSVEIAKLTYNRVHNGAILVIGNETGAVRAYVGSNSWFTDDSFGKIDGVAVRNQPGSCLKPFLYAFAIENGFGPNTILPDIPSSFGINESYAPANFNHRFNGPVRLRVALASSLNIPAVWTLERLGVSRFKDFLGTLGFNSVLEKTETYGLGLALGNAEVSLEELTRAFSLFETDGVLNDLKFILSPESGYAPTPQRKISPYTAFIIGDVLSDEESRWTGFGRNTAFRTRFSAMFKTGTANQYQNIWALGATKRWTVGVWMGNFSGETVVGKTGSSIPALIARDLLSLMERRDTPSATREELVFVEEKKICALSGLSATGFCPGIVGEYFHIGQESPLPCFWHSGGNVAYPPEYRAWLTEHFRTGETEKSAQGLAEIRLPRDGTIFYMDTSDSGQTQGARVETTGFGDAAVYLDGIFQGNLNSAGVFILPLSPGCHTVNVRGEGNSASAAFEVK